MATIKDAKTNGNAAVTMDEKTTEEFANDPECAEIFIVTGLSRISTFLPVSVYLWHLP